MDKVIAMSSKELARTDIFLRVKEKVLTQQEAADILGLSCRQVRRLFKAYKKQGALTLISKKRGKPSNHQPPPAAKELALALIQENYADFGPTLACEKLAEVHQLKISVWSVRRIMMALRPTRDGRQACRPFHDPRRFKLELDCNSWNVINLYSCPGALSNGKYIHFDLFQAPDTPM